MDIKKCRECLEEKKINNTYFVKTMYKGESKFSIKCRDCINIRRQELRSIPKEIKKKRRYDDMYMDDKKKCSTCKEFKPMNLDNFQKRPGGSDGFLGRCRDCLIKYRRTNNYSVSSKEQEKIWKQQGMNCPICKIIFTRKWGRNGNDPALDHCHTSGKFRGFPCNNCNRGLGYFMDNVGFLESAIDYLRSSA